MSESMELRNFQRHRDTEGDNYYSGISAAIASSSSSSSSYKQQQQHHHHHNNTGHGDFGGFDNDAIDFRHLEDYINGDDENNIYFPETLVGSEVKNPEPTNSNGIKNTTNQSLPPIQQPQLTQAQNQQLLYGLCPPPTVPYKNGSIGNGYNHGAHHHLPDSPPDSGSEPPYSPPNEEQKNHSSGGGGGSGSIQDLLLPPMSGRKQLLSYNNTQPLKHLPDIQILSQQQQRSHPATTTTNSAPPTLQPPPLPSQHLQNNSGSLQPLSIEIINGPMVPPGLGSSFGSLQGVPIYPGSKKRKLCESPNGSGTSVGSGDGLNGLMHIKQEPGSGGGVVLPPPPQPPTRHCVSPDQGSNQSLVQVQTGDDDLGFDFSSDSGAAFVDSAFQCIRFQHFQPASWHVICDNSLKELPTPNYRVDADKGFNFSNADDAFVCQKKNHFQVTVHAQQSSDPAYVRTAEGLKKIDAFYVHFYGVKVESQSQSIKIEQSQSDRSKKPFHPVPVEFSREQMIKLTVGRLHFSETTSNNMRKKGKPNPDQRYFFLVVGLHAHSGDGNYPIVSQCSERIIVRASNPGQFESEVELSWQKGQTTDSIFHAGRVGINMDRPDEPLVVHGNVKITGHIIQPSDARAKEDIEEVDTKEQLRNLQQLRIVRYQYNEEFAQHAGLAKDERSDTGVIAQEVQKVIPDAVKAAGDIVLPSGKRIDNFLVVNKDRIFIENIGAVKELCRVTDNLENRIDELERMNNKLARLKRLDSMKSTSSSSTITSLPSLTSTKQPLRRRHHHRHHHLNRQGLCSSKFVQGTIIGLILVMAMCLIAMATLYILEWQKRQVYDFAPNSITNQDLTKITSNFSRNVSVTNSTFGLSRTPANGTGTSTSSSTQRGGTSAVIHATSSSFTVRVHGRRDPIGVPANCIGSNALTNNCSSFCCNDQEESNSRKPIQSSSQSPTRFTTTSSPSSTTNMTSRNSVNVSQTEEAASARNIPQVILGGDGSNGTRNPAVSTVTSYPQRSSNSRSYEPSTEENISVDISENKLPVSEGENNDARQDQYPTVIRLNKPYPFIKMKNSAEKPTRQKRRRRRSIGRRLMFKRGAAPQTGAWSVTNRSGINFASLVRSVRLLEFNHTISPEYCSTCREGNYTYLIPVSRYMTQQTLTMQFRLSSATNVYVDYCQTGNKITECSSMYGHDSPDSVVNGGITNERKAEELTPSWILPIGKFVESSYKFRVTNIPNHTDACMADSEFANITFAEYNFVFYRTCSE